MIPLGIVAAATPRAVVSPGWTPAELSPIEWWDFSDNSRVSVVSGAVASITSRVAGGRSASSSGTSRPSFASAVQNGRDAAIFDGLNDFLALSSSLLTTSEMWVAQVFGRASSGIKSQVLGGGTRGEPPYASQWWTNDVRYSALWGTGGGYATHGSAGAETGVFQHVLVKGSTTTELYQDGSAIGTPQTNGGGTGAIYYIGRRESDYHAGMLCEIIVGTSALSSSDRENLEGYLAHKWGLAGSLPVSHPYRDAPP